MSKVSKASQKNFALIVSPQSLELKQKNITSIINALPSNEMHEKYTQMAGLFKMVDYAVRHALMQRIRKIKDKIIETDIGRITYHERSNYVFEEDKIKEFLGKKKIPLHKVYDYNFEVISKNKSILQKLEKDGIITKVEKLNKDKFIKLAEEHPELLDFAEDNFTPYLKGL